MEARQILGWNVRKARVERGLSQEALAFDAEIDRAYLSRIERAKENVTLNVIEALARVLDISIAELFRIPAIDERKPAGLKAGRRKGNRRI